MDQYQRHHRSTRRFSYTPFGRLSVYLLALLLISQTGCLQTKPFDIPETEPILVLNALIEAQSINTIYLSRTWQGDRPDSIVPQGGVVWVKRNNGVWKALQESESGQFTWLEDLPQAGDEVEVKAMAPGYPEITAKTLIPLPVETASAQWTDRTILGDDGTLQSILAVALTDPEIDQENHFMLLSFGERLADGERFALDLKTNNPVLEFQVVYTEPNKSRPGDFIRYNPNFFTDEFFANGEISLDFYLPKRSLDRARDLNEERWGIQLIGLDEAAFRFLRTADQAKLNDDNLFAEPQPIYSNIEGGAGVWGAMTRREYIAEW
ncbi:MAG: DUF4249 domain-containing protein [Bacteroidota bacterium]